MMIHRVGERLAPQMVRAKLFGRRWRGFDPAQVNAYLDRVADELTHLDQELGRNRSDAERAGLGLRRWQSRHVGRKLADPRWLHNGRRR